MLLQNINGYFEFCNIIFIENKIYNYEIENVIM